MTLIKRANQETQSQIASAAIRLTSEINMKTQSYENPYQVIGSTFYRKGQGYETIISNGTTLENEIRVHGYITEDGNIIVK